MTVVLVGLAAYITGVLVGVCGTAWGLRRMGVLTDDMD